MIAALAIVCYIVGGVVTTRIGRKYFPDTFNESGANENIPALASFLFWIVLAVLGILAAIWLGCKWLCTVEVKLPKRKHKPKDLDYKLVERLEIQEFPHLPVALRTSPPGVEFQEVWKPYDGD